MRLPRLAQHAPTAPEPTSFPEAAGGMFVRAAQPDRLQGLAADAIARLAVAVVGPRPGPGASGTTLQGDDDGGTAVAHGARHTGAVAPSETTAHASLPTGAGKPGLAGAATKPQAPPAGSGCSVCLETLECGDAVRILAPCAHGSFHVACADSWLRRSGTCPLCRAAVIPPRAAKESRESSAADGPVSDPSAVEMESV